MSMEAWSMFNGFCSFGIMIVMALFCTIVIDKPANKNCE